MNGFTIGGVTMRAGEAVIVANHVANRDPELFTDPDHVDLGRDNARQHLGEHFLIGRVKHPDPGIRRRIDMTLRNETAVSLRYPELSADPYPAGRNTGRRPPGRS